MFNFNINICLIFFLSIIFNDNCDHIGLCSLTGYSSSACMIGEGIYQALIKNFQVINVSSRYHNNQNRLYKKFSQSIFADVLCYEDDEFYKNHLKAKINIAYSMFESSQLPKIIVDIINKNFDMVIVPDKFLFDVYKNSGVIKDVKVLPLYIPDLELFEKKENYNIDGKLKFLFNTGLHRRKGIDSLIDGFILAFGNNDSYELTLHLTWGLDDTAYFEYIKNKIKNYKNIIIDTSAMQRKKLYAYYKNFDCYIAPSGGEGFSLTPREAMASGLHCIVLNYGTQKTLCESGLVMNLEPDVYHKVEIDVYGGDVGHIYLASAENVCASLIKFVNNYQNYCKYAKKTRDYILHINNQVPNDLKEILMNNNQKLNNQINVNKSAKNTKKNNNPIKNKKIKKE